MRRVRGHADFEADYFAHLRSLRYARLPFLVWYVYDASDPSAGLWLVRLFHARQLRPRPDLSRWLPPR